MNEVQLKISTLVNNSLVRVVALYFQALSTPSLHSLIAPLSARGLLVVPCMCGGSALKHCLCWPQAGTIFRWNCGFSLPQPSPSTVSYIPEDQRLLMTALLNLLV